MGNNTYNNLSDGNTDGIVLFYMKGGKLYPIGLTEEQAGMLDLVICTPFADRKLIVGATPVAYSTIKHMLDK